LPCRRARSISRNSASIPVRPRSAKPPPAPGPALQDWERDPIQRWADAPVKGPPPEGNRRPRIRVNQLPASAKTQLSFIATTEDPDNDSVIGVVQLAGMTVKMSQPGTFAVHFDLTDMAPGTHRLGAVLCDGWGSAAHDLGPLRVEK
jgi:hypothetical protein